MKQIFEDGVVIFMIIISVFVHMYFISANLEITAAREFHSNAVERIQASNFNQNVINDIQEEALKREWKIETQNVSVYDDRPDLKVTLKYNIIKLPTFGSDASNEDDSDYKYTIIGYAR